MNIELDRLYLIAGIKKCRSKPRQASSYSLDSVHPRKVGNGMCIFLYKDSFKTIFSSFFLLLFLYFLPFLKSLRLSFKSRFSKYSKGEIEKKHRRLKKVCRLSVFSSLKDFIIGCIKIVLSRKKLYL